MSIEIKISARIISWPACCACCGQPADSEVEVSHERTTGKKVQKTATKTWRVPYCSACIEHKNDYEAAGSALLLGIAGGAVALAVVLWNGGGLTLSIISAVVCIYIGWHFTKRATKAAEAKMHPTCATPDVAVKYHGWEGSVHTFEFENADYYEAFSNANKKKLLA